MEIIQLIESKIIKLQNKQVIIDSEVASLYGVETKRINEAVNNNPDKFPEGYIIILAENDLDDLRTKFSTTKLSKTRVMPKAFTEKGLYMLATILKSPKATETTLAIIETFAKIRQLGQNMNQLALINDEKARTPLLQKSGELIAEILDSDLKLSETETTIEINFAVLKFKHTIKAKKQ